MYAAGKTQDAQIKLKPPEGFRAEWGSLFEESEQL